MSNDMLNVIFEARLEDIAHTTEKDKEFLQANCNFGDIYTNLESLINEKCGEEANHILLILDDFIQEKFKIAFGNRIKKQINLFVPVYMACGYSELEGLDYMLCNKILIKFEALNLTFLQNELDELYNKLDELFGVGAFKVSQAYILDLKKMI
jgi:hypothetical protein